MKAVFEIFVTEINIVTVKSVLHTILSNKNITSVLYYFNADVCDADTLKRVGVFLNYMKQSIPTIQCDYIITGCIDGFWDMVLFASKLCKDITVNRDAVSIKSLSECISRTLLLHIPADVYYFYINKPEYENHVIEFVEEELATKNIDIYGKFATGVNFDAFASHVPLSQDIELFLRSIGCVEDVDYYGRYHRLRFELKRQNNYFMRGPAAEVKTDVFKQVSQDIYKRLLIYNNF